MRVSNAAAIGLLLVGGCEQQSQTNEQPDDSTGVVGTEKQLVMDGIHLPFHLEAIVESPPNEGKLAGELTKINVSGEQTMPMIDRDFEHYDSDIRSRIEGAGKEPLAKDITNLTIAGESNTSPWQALYGMGRRGEPLLRTDEDLARDRKKAGLADALRAYKRGDYGEAWKQLEQVRKCYGVLGQPVDPGFEALAKETKLPESYQYRIVASTNVGDLNTMLRSPDTMTATYEGDRILLRKNLRQKRITVYGVISNLSKDTISVKPVPTELRPGLNEALGLSKGTTIQYMH